MDLIKPNSKTLKDKTLTFSATFDKCGSDDDKVFKEKYYLHIIKVLCLIHIKYKSFMPFSLLMNIHIHLLQIKI